MQINESYEDFKYSVIEQFPWDLDVESYITEDVDNSLRELWEERNIEISRIGSASEIDIALWEYIERGVSLISDETDTLSAYDGSLDLAISFDRYKRYDEEFITEIKENTYSDSELSNLSNDDQQEILIYAPSIKVLRKLSASNLDSLNWREFEELVAELLKLDGYKVELGRGTKDGGVDIITTKEVERFGLIQGVWQLKKTKNKVGISVVRELADTTREMKASKGIIVTTSYLTRAAIQRIEQDEYILGKVERSDLDGWISKVLNPENIA